MQNLKYDNEQFLANARAKEQEANSLAQKLYQEITHLDTANRCQLFGQLISKSIEVDFDFQELYFKWTLEETCKRQTTCHIPLFKEAFDILIEKGFTKRKRFEYGDIDNGAWAEQINETLRYIAVECYCSAASARLYVFTLESYPAVGDVIPARDSIKLYRILPKQFKKLRGGNFSDNNLAHMSYDTFSSACSCHVKHEEVINSLWVLRNLHREVNLIDNPGHVA